MQVLSPFFFMDLGENSVGISVATKYFTPVFEKSITF